MLVQIREVVTRFGEGLNPYIVYYVPWELPLSYGPWLWMWFLIPHALAADLRFDTIFGQAFVAQVGVMAVVCVLAWWRLRAGDPVAPWFVAALAAFSMTTLWPVWYVFLDVFVLGLALLAADWSPRLRTRPWLTAAGAAGLTVATIAGTLIVTPGVYYAIEPGHAPRWHLGSGFGEDARDEAGGTRGRRARPSTCACRAG